MGATIIPGVEVSWFVVALVLVIVVLAGYKYTQNSAEDPGDAAGDGTGGAMRSRMRPGCCGASGVKVPAPMKGGEGAGMKAAFDTARGRSRLSKAESARISRTDGHDVFARGIASMEESRMLSAMEGAPSHGADDTNESFDLTKRAGMSATDYTTDHLQATLPAGTQKDHARWTASLVNRAAGGEDTTGLPGDAYLSRLSAASGAEIEYSPLAGVHSVWQMLNAQNNDVCAIGGGNKWNRGSVEGRGRDLGETVLGSSRIASVQHEDPDRDCQKPGPCAVKNYRSQRVRTVGQPQYGV